MISLDIIEGTCFLLSFVFVVGFHLAAWKGSMDIYNAKSKEEQQKDDAAAVIGLLVIGLVCLWGYGSIFGL